MLANHPIDPMILATDLAVAREFYGERIGLELLLESDDFLTFKCGGDSRLVVTRSSTGTTEPQTKASWRVSDLAAEVAELRSRGVEVQEYDEPGLKTVDGIADVGFALAAWLVDPHGNSIGLLQFKGADAIGRTSDARHHDRDPARQAGSRGPLRASSRGDHRRGRRVPRPSRGRGVPTASAGRRIPHRLPLRHRRAPARLARLDEHAAWLERAEPHVIGPMRTSFVTGLESWFTLPGQPGACRRRRTRWRCSPGSRSSR